MPQPAHQFSRRQFLQQTCMASAGIGICAANVQSALAGQASGSPIVVFSKVYQELKLSFDDAAAVTAEAGLDGVDCPVRPGGEILPEHAAEELPRYVETL